MMEDGRLLLSALVPDGKDWVDVVAAPATPIIAALALMFAYRGYLLEHRRRVDQLFDRRSDFFGRFWQLVLEVYSTPHNPQEESEPKYRYWRYWQVYEKQINMFAVEARFLFGKRTEIFLRNVYKRDPIKVPEKSEERFKVELPAWLVEHFSPYLMLEK